MEFYAYERRKIVHVISRSVLDHPRDAMKMWNLKGFGKGGVSSAQTSHDRRLCGGRGDISKVLGVPKRYFSPSILFFSQFSLFKIA